MFNYKFNELYSFFGDCTVALGVDGKLYGSGLNEYGCLLSGNLEMDFLSTMEKIDESSNVVNIILSSNSRNMIILKNDGGLYNYGNNDNGQYGNGTDIKLQQGEKIEDFVLKDIQQIALSTNSTFILKNDGSLWACGINNLGQLGLGDKTDRTTFTQVTTNINNDVKQIVCGGYHTFILKNDGSVWACGYNDRGQLGLGTSGSSADRTTFTQVTTNINNDVKQIVCGYNHTFILKNDGSVWACGNNSNGQLGLNSTTKMYTSFTQVTTNINNDVKQIVCGGLHEFILKNDGSLWACGLNGYGQLGLGDKTNRSTFTQVTTNINNDVKQIVCGQDHTFILKNDGSVWATGYNSNGQLGLNSTTKMYTSFTQVTTNINNDVKQIVCGYNFTVILKNDGSVWACGNNNNSLLKRTVPLYSEFNEIYSGLDINKIKHNAFEDTIGVLKNNNELYVAGSNGYSELGFGNYDEVTTLTKLIDDVKDFWLGDCCLFILKNDGTLWSCGSNYCGEAGLPESYEDCILPTQVPNGSNVKKIIPSYDYSENAFMLKNDGTLWVTGYNNYGELGSSTKYIYGFTQVIGDVKEIARGFNHTFILKNDGSVWVTGLNNYGQLGLGDNTDRNTFTQVDISNVKKITSHYNVTAIVKNDGTLWVNGFNANGMLGLGDKTNRNTFTQVDINNVKDAIVSWNTIFIITEEGLYFTGYDLGFNITKPGQYYLTPNKIDLDIDTADIKCITIDEYNCFIVMNNGDAYVCGVNDYYNTGIHTSESHSKVFISGFMKYELPKEGCDYDVYIDGELTHVKDFASNNKDFEVISTGDNFIYVKGNNTYGQLGTGNNENVENYTKVVFNTPIKRVICGEKCTVCLDNNGELFVSGSNGNGQIGLGDTAEINTFTVVENDVKYIYLSKELCVIEKNGDIFVTGANKWNNFTKFDF